MTTLHALRRQHGLSFSELAHLTGISVRRLAAFEYHDHPLAADEQARLAAFFGLAQRSLHSGMIGTTTLASDTIGHRRLLAALAAATTLALALPLRPTISLPQPVSWSWSFVTASAALSDERASAAAGQPPTPNGGLAPPAPRRTAPVRAAPPRDAIRPARRAPAADAPLSALERRALDDRQRRLARALPTRQATPQPMPTSAAAALPRPPADTAGDHRAATERLGAAPRGCPLVPPVGRVVITQGYAEGTHLPSAIWGALDLGVAGGPTAGTLVVATHAGRAEVVLDSWPAGNYVAVQGEDGWRTAYAHLAQVFVVAGQSVAAGTPLGTVGSTGMATGPHLHYEIWRHGVNLDPSPWLACR
ncbi:peptidoglycan DD-metalloendopeptidase family protein [Kallotenue papyrolyticum]|uniref:peptidoglycan DD-metalloendopeptidase family protein n=1 Tax=Kallotenue papyrolyticum TaxID=1325125 RepID=UPI0004785E9E|nr:peptidoglycan DD-metalloendopeptidase family protein [Kallotenue papyrolyticum]